ncbi:DUF2442 domain-containing protein [Aceticella autotrophica]|uniref:DUF2442 domain-containing protein n=1 Tax=Aceticella autotrophica TaxID=2755338 RepID=A0A975GAB5_9THEO|nr:DUF2442 domain-containing protein [Aceticella autotrophica]QSZ26996.1 DUF2442 domain-containing protein [Aceticella autotrophica]
MKSPDIIRAKVLDDYLIHITFENGEERIFDIKPYLKYPVFKPLKDEKEFNSYKIVDGTIEWSCGADLSTDTFYIESKALKNNAIM